MKEPTEEELTEADKECERRWREEMARTKAQAAEETEDEDDAINTAAEPAGSGSAPGRLHASRR